MSAVNQLSTGLNKNLVALQSSISCEPTEMEWVVISTGERLIKKQLSKVVDERTSAHLSLPTEALNFSEEAFNEVFRWCLEETGTRHLLLVGSSSVTPTPLSESGSQDGSFDPLLGAQNVQSQISDAKAHFANQVSQLADNPVIASAISGGRLQLHTLFYVSQSRSFQVYDRKTWTYKSLAG